MSREERLPLTRKRRLTRARHGIATGQPAVANETVEVLEKPEGLTYRDWVIFLLNASVEIEHAMLVQYLFTMYSLDTSQQLPRRWAHTIRQVATEEMGHLLTVQNVLRCLRAPLNVGREGFPFRAQLYPFPFRLRKFSKPTIALYVLAELPPEGVDEAVLPVAERKQIEANAAAAARSTSDKVNQVGIVYNTLLDALEHLDDADFGNDSIHFQSGQSDWAQNLELSEDRSTRDGVKALLIDSKQTAREALEVIALQGQGASDGNLDGSHFLSFLGIYREFEAGHVRNIVENPNTNDAEAVNSSTITHPKARIWAELFNLRYRILLTSLGHGLSIPRGSARDLLLDWVASEIYSLTAIAQRLLSLPLAESVAEPLAAPPFELPSTHALPDQDRGRWTLHLDLVNASAHLIAKLLPDDVANRLHNVDGVDSNSGRRQEISERIARAAP